MKLNSKRALVLSCGTAAAVMIGAVSLVISRPVAATPQFAMETGKACAACHTNPKGGGALTAFGDKFKANGNKLPK